MEEQAQAQAQAGGGNGNHQQMGQQEGDELDRELADAEVAGDDGFEDDEDMLDKMSSSPSIADGAIPVPPLLEGICVNACNGL